MFHTHEKHKAKAQFRILKVSDSSLTDYGHSTDILYSPTVYPLLGQVSQNSSRTAFNPEACAYKLLPPSGCGLVSDGTQQPVCLSFKEQALCLTVTDESEALT